MLERLIMLSLLFMQPSMVSPDHSPILSDLKPDHCISQNLLLFGFQVIFCQWEAFMQDLKGAGEKAEFI